MVQLFIARGRVYESTSSVVIVLFHSMLSGLLCYLGLSILLHLQLKVHDTTKLASTGQSYPMGYPFVL